VVVIASDSERDRRFVGSAVAESNGQSQFYGVGAVVGYQATATGQRVDCSRHNTGHKEEKIRFQDLGPLPDVD
jgi:hypothetical protein